MRFFGTVFMALMIAACGPPKAQDADVIMKNIHEYAGKRVVIRAKFRSGARCGQPRELGEKWKTFCGSDKDCAYCRGPVVLDTGGALNLSEEGLDDWPMILGGTYDGQDIRCKGPLNEVECFPFKVGKTYIVQGQIEAQRPPKLLVENFWDVEESSK